MPDPTNITDLAANTADLTEEEIKALTPEADAVPVIEGAPPAVEGEPPAPAAAVEGDPAATAAAAAGEPAAAVVEAPATAPAPSTPFAPVYNGTGRDFDAELAAVEAERVALKEKYKAGGMEDEAYEAEFDRLNELRGDLRLDQRSEQIAQDFSKQNQDQSWAYLQRQWLSRPENAAIMNDPLLFNSWEDAMQLAVNEAATQGKILGDWDLMEAARRPLADRGWLPAIGASVAPVTGAVVPPKPAPRTAPFSDVPATLGGAPSAAAAGSQTTVDDLQGVDIQDLEDRFAGYSEAQRDALLRQVPGAATYEAN